MNYVYKYKYITIKISNILISHSWWGKSGDYLIVMTFIYS